MEFTFNGYLNILDKLDKNGYKFVDYNYYNYDKCVILRHDVDYSPKKALELAKYENEFGVSSTYFILISSPFYNVVSNETLKVIQNIKELGHKIGLHFDELNYSEEYYIEHGGIKNVILKEAELLENVLDLKVGSVSMHRPSTNTLEADYDFGEIVNSYSKTFFKEFKYVSDSRRMWRENVDDIIQSGVYNRLHILTHAFWYNENEINIKESVKRFVQRGNIDRYNSLENNITDLNKLLKKGEI